VIEPEYLRHVVERLESFRSHPLGFRVAGTPEERAATAFIAAEFRAAGLTDVVEEPVPVDAWRFQDAFVELQDGQRFEAASFGGVPETGASGVTGELVHVGRGGRKQLDRVDVRGKIVLVDWLVQRLWPYHVGLELGLRGAAAMIATSPRGGPYYQADGALGSFDGIWHERGVPCVTIRREDAATLTRATGARVRLVLDAPCGPAEAANVVGVLSGTQDGAPAIVGGHHDGWFGAAFDDASAVAITLALAHELAAGEPPAQPIVFVSHTAEEYGIARSAYDWCYGAWYQIVETHRDWSTDARFYLNLEGCGRPDPFTVDTPPELERWARRLCASAARDGLLPHGFRIARPTTWTEVWPFVAAGVPGMNVSTFTTAFDRTEYHTQYDASDRIDFAYLARLARVCARFLREADAGAADELEFDRRARDLRGVLDPSALRALEDARGRAHFTAVGRGLYGLDAGETAAYPHAQTAKDVKLLEQALEHLRADRPGLAARAVARVGLNWLCSDLGRDAFRLERGRRGRDARRACWAALGDPDVGPDLWNVLASLREEDGARPPGAWVEAELERSLDYARLELARRLKRMAAAARGEIFPLPRPSRDDLPDAGSARFP